MSVAQSCFPDVTGSFWFVPYVCAAKQLGIVSGYPDGTFKPANSVNYAEALKILVGIYGYTLPSPPQGQQWPWYTPYVQAASEHGVLLTSNPSLDTLLTRGQMAELAAAFRAEHDGQLSQYRTFEQGSLASESASSSSMSSSSSVLSGSGSSSSLSSASSSMSNAQTALFPSQSHFLVTGSTTAPILDGTFTSPDEDAYLRQATVIFRQQVKSFDSLILVDATGNKLATLSLDTNNNTDSRQWTAVIADNSFTFKKGVPTVLGIEGVMKSRDNGGISNELVEVQGYAVYTQGISSGISQQIVPVNTHYPMHQTAQADITAIRNSLSSSSTMSAGTNQKIASFNISGLAASGSILTLSEMDFVLQRTDVTVSHIRIGGDAAINQADCGSEQTDLLRISCPVIPDSVKTISTTPQTISIFGDVTDTGAGNGQLQLVFEGPGAIGQNGAIKWNDGSATFNWIEASTPLQNGTIWTVTKGS